MPRLVIESSDGERHLALTDKPVRVGSARGSDVHVTGKNVESKHCTIEQGRAGWRVRDGGARSTLVNGKSFMSRRLKHGDRISVGPATIVFEDDPEETGSPVAASKALAPPPSSRSAAEDLTRLTTTLRALASETDVKKLLSLIVDQVISLTGAERGFLILRKDAKFEMVAARTLDRENVRRPGLKISRAVADEVARTGKPLLTTNAQADARLRGSKSVTGMKLRSVLCVPLAARGRFLGFLYVDHRFEEGTFQHSDVGYVAAFADQAAVALEDMRLVAELRERTAELERSHERIEELNRLLEERVDRQQRELDEVRTLLRDRGDRPLKYEYENIVGRSAAMREVLRLVDHVTDTSMPVLILGESGTGKELVARAIHVNGPRAAESFVTENCAAIPESLLESALFGHVRGAFTGADRERTGLFELADRGTLFLDEIGDLPLATQVKLLRVLETGELRPVGGKDTVTVDVRVLSATHRDLAGMVEDGTFRRDLYYRIHVLEVRLPPLRDRPEDIPDLVIHFLAQQAGDHGPKTITDDALAFLVGYAWPGNVRQLRNEVLRAVALSGNVIIPEVLSAGVRDVSVPVAAASAGVRPLREVVQEAVDLVERRSVLAALRRAGWKKAEAARLLEVSRPTLDAKIKRFEITRDPEE